MAVGEESVQIVARVSSRIFGGTELSRYKEWADATINFVINGSIGAQRPLASYWIPELSKISHHQVTAKRVIIPILKRSKRT